MAKIGIVQHAPVHLDLEQSMKKVMRLIREAVRKGAEMIFFGESWLTGYPAWLDYCPEVALWDHKPTKTVYARMYKNSITVPGNETDQLSGLARELNILVGLGLNEKTESGSGTIYNSLIMIDQKGHIVIHHRKLMPTFTEKILYGYGDGYGLKTYQSNFGKIGGLICWEHWMPHARQALHDSGELIHLAVWPTVHDIHQLACRHYAFEGRCFVIAIGQIMKREDIPSEFAVPRRTGSGSDNYILRGGSCVIGPDGKYISEPIFDREEIFIVDINPDQAVGEKMTLDTAGHYYRPDIFKFRVNRTRIK
ncbi:MAG: carbon-nitrogen hydrolase family protein [Bacteroidales bacterium]|nr:MAG: carbon-nitrogen hydrolase family protein [Bacteroidales bacterium]